MEDSKKFARSRKLFERLRMLFSTGDAQVAILMSGGGSNAENILSNRNLYPTVQFKLIVTNKKESNAEKIAKKYGLKYLYKQASFKNTEDRITYFQELASELEAEGINALVYAGFMKIVTDEFLTKFPGINSHPADLTVRDEDDEAKYVGMDAIARALDDGNTTVCCTTCIVDNPVDNGMPIALSNDVIVTEGTNEDILNIHERIKKEAEWFYYPRVLEKLSKGELTIENIPFKFTK